MAKNLTTNSISKIIGIIDGWEGKLTWELLIDEIEPYVGKFSRQSLNAHSRIKLAFQERKKTLRQNPNTAGKSFSGSSDSQKMLERIKRLEAENNRLKRENSIFLEKFARWAYNAYAKGINPEDLDNPLPEIDRERTPEGD